MSSTNKKSNKKWYIGISLISIIVIILLLIWAYSTYTKSTSLFSSYNQSNNTYISTDGQNGLQYIPLPNGVEAYIDSNSSFATQKQSMISRALSSLETAGISAGYLDLEDSNQSNQFSTYVLLIIVLIIIIGGICCYAAFEEDKKKISK